MNCQSGIPSAVAGRRSVSLFRFFSFLLYPKLYLPLTVSATVVTNIAVYLLRCGLLPTFTVVVPMKSSFLYIERPIEPSPSHTNTIQLPFVINACLFSTKRRTPLLLVVAPIYGIVPSTKELTFEHLQFSIVNNSTMRKTDHLTFFKLSITSSFFIKKILPAMSYHIKLKC